MINRENVELIEEFQGKSKNYKKNKREREKSIAFLVGATLLTIAFDLLYNLKFKHSFPGVSLSFGIIVYDLLWIYNDKYHETNHERECPDKGKIINDERFLPYGIQPWETIRRSLLAPYEKNKNLFVVLADVEIMWLLYACNANFETGMLTLVCVVTLMLVQAYYIGRVSSSDFSSKTKIEEILRKNNISYDKACVGFDTKDEDGMSTVFVSVYRFIEYKEE